MIWEAMYRTFRLSERKWENRGNDRNLTVIISNLRSIKFVTDPLQMVNRIIVSRINHTADTSTLGSPAIWSVQDQVSFLLELKNSIYKIFPLWIRIAAIEKFVGCGVRANVTRIICWLISRRSSKHCIINTPNTSTITFSRTINRGSFAFKPTGKQVTMNIHQRYWKKLLTSYFLLSDSLKQARHTTSVTVTTRQTTGPITTWRFIWREMPRHAPAWCHYEVGFSFPDTWTFFLI